VVKELEAYRAGYLAANGAEPPPPVCAGWTFVDESAERAREQARRWIGGYFETVLEHYRFHEGHLVGQKGYEYYGKMNEKIDKYGKETFIDFFVDLQVWGTPSSAWRRSSTSAVASATSTLSGSSAMRACPRTRPSATCVCSRPR